jgi:hypothetical protein
MTMVSIDLGDGRRLELEPARHVVRMVPAVAGAQLELTVRAVAAGPSNPEPVLLAATVYASDSLQQGRRMLCRVRARYHVAPTARGAEVQLIGQIGDEQLRTVEEMRAGGQLWLCLAVEASGVLADPPRPVVWLGELNIPVSSGEWAEQVERVDAGALVEVLVPLPHGADLAGAVERLREARRLLRDNEIDAALGAARKALEPVLEAARDGGVSKGAAAKPARERDLPERFAVMVEATHSVLCGAAHDDDVTAVFRYTRSEAQALIATAAGLVKRLAEARP